LISFNPIADWSVPTAPREIGQAKIESAPEPFDVLAEDLGGRQPRRLSRADPSKAGAISLAGRRAASFAAGCRALREATRQDSRVPILKTANF
jgi:hypothetical protein